jgi:predicted PurR-regulated permease PerM
VVPRWIQLVLLPLALVGLWALARAAGTVLLILVAASTIALIFNPLVRILKRRGVPRGVAILLIYLGMVAALFGIGVFLANTVSTQVANFQHDLPSIIRQANHDLTNVQNWLNQHGLHIRWSTTCPRTRAASSRSPATCSGRSCRWPSISCW